MKNLLVPVDFSGVTERLIDASVEMARVLNAKVWLLNCVREFPAFSPPKRGPWVLTDPGFAESEMFSEEHHQLMAFVALVKDKGVEADAMMAVGLPADEILRVAEQLEAHLILLGSHGHGALYDLVVGSVTQSVLRRTRCLTLIVPSELGKPVAVPYQTTWEEPAATPY